MAFDLQPTLVGRRVRLRPLTPDDFDALFAISSDPLLWEQHPAKERAEADGFRAWFADASASGGQLVATSVDGDAVLGTSRFWEYEPGAVEIGWTFVARAHWGDGTNDEIKHLMLTHAFADVDTVRFRVHCDNIRSQRAVRKLGAVPVGTEESGHGHGTNVVFTLPRAAWVERSLARYYDQEADERATRDLQPPRLAARAAFAASLPAPTTLLEVGVGTGRDAAGFVAAGHHVVGVDLSVAFATHAQRAGATVLLASARALPFADASFRALWTMSTLMHIPSAAIEGALDELARVLAPGGVAGIGVWGGADVEDYLVNPRYDPPRLFSRRSDARWQTLLERVGTVEHFERWDDAGDPFWYQYAVVRRP